jgi:hypothetical protein
MAGEALSCLIRFVSVLLGHEPFLPLMTALAQFADLLLEQLFMLCGMGIVTAGTFKFFKRIMSPLLSQLLFNVWMTIEACFEANRRLLSPSRLCSQDAYKDYRKKRQIAA